jgi:hypothetical protein
MVRRQSVGGTRRQVIWGRESLSESFLTSSFF